jgi:hypothetical protein
MMTWCEERRPSAREMLGDPWVREGGLAGDNVLEPEVLQRLRSFADMNKLKQHTLLVRLARGKRLRGWRQSQLGVVGVLPWCAGRGRVVPAAGRPALLALSCVEQHTAADARTAHTHTHTHMRARATSSWRSTCPRTR